MRQYKNNISLRFYVSEFKKLIRIKPPEPRLATDYLSSQQAGCDLVLLITTSWPRSGKTTWGEQGGDALGGRGWRSKINPTCCPGGDFPGGLGLFEALRAPRCTFPALFAHTVISEFHMDPFSSAMASQGTINFLASTRAPQSQCFRETKRTLNRRKGTASNYSETNMHLNIHPTPLISDKFKPLLNLIFAWKPCKGPRYHFDYFITCCYRLGCLCVYTFMIKHANLHTMICPRSRHMVLCRWLVLLKLAPVLNPSTKHIVHIVYRVKDYAMHLFQWLHRNSRLLFIFDIQ